MSSSDWKACEREFPNRSSQHRGCQVIRQNCTPAKQRPFPKLTLPCSCRRTVFLEVAYFTLITLFAHIVLTLRVYAITGKDKRIASGLYALSIVQLGVGVYLCAYSSLHPRTCSYYVWRALCCSTTFRGSSNTSDSHGCISDVSFPDPEVRVTRLHFPLSRIR